MTNTIQRNMLKRAMFMLTAFLLISPAAWAQSSNPSAVDDEAIEALCPDDNHPHMIDLGLSTGIRWACCNVNAQAPEDYGGYYAWGETEEKQEYSWEQYKWRGTEPDTYQDIGNDISGTQYDVARAKWGDKWRMPLGKEFYTLKSECTSEWVTRNGINGRLFTGPSGAKLFIPASGVKNNNSSEPDKIFGIGVYACFHFPDLSMGELTEYFIKEDHISSQGPAYRFEGRAVRAITGPEGIAIDETNFPDKNFRNMLLARTAGIDGILTPNEIADIVSLFIMNMNISDLSGIEFFTALENLYCDGNNLSTLDVSALTKLRYLTCYQNNIKGANMDALMQSLPVIPDDENAELVIYNEKETDGNVVTLDQVAVAVDKGWTVKYLRKDGEFVKYPIAPVTKYPVWVGGVQVTDNNVSDVLGDGNITYTPDYGYGTLTINTPTTITTTTNNEAIYARGIGLTINAPNGLRIESNYKGIRVNGDGNILIINGNVNINSKLVGIDAYNVMLNGTDHVIQTDKEPAIAGEGSVSFTGKLTASSNQMPAIMSLGTITIPSNYEITTPQDGQVKALKIQDVSFNTIVDANGDYAKTVVITPKGHTLVAVDATWPSCTEFGTMPYWLCTTCLKLFNDPDGQTEISEPDMIPPTGHIWGDWEVTRHAEPGKPGEQTQTCSNDASHKNTRAIYAITVTGGTASDTEAAEGEKITVTANTNGSEFLKWNVTKGQITIDATSATATFTMPGEEVEIEALSTTAIGGITNKETADDTWYNIYGHKLSGKPTQRGVYIRNGRMVVIK